MCVGEIYIDICRYIRYLDVQIYRYVKKGREREYTYTESVHYKGRESERVSVREKCA